MSRGNEMLLSSLWVPVYPTSVLRIMGTFNNKMILCDDYYYDSKHLSQVKVDRKIVISSRKKKTITRQTTLVKTGTDITQI